MQQNLRKKKIELLLVFSSANLKNKQNQFFSLPTTKKNYLAE